MSIHEEPEDRSREFTRARSRTEAADPEQWERALKQKRAMASPMEPQGDPGPEVLDRFGHGDEGVLLTAGGSVPVRPVANPNERASLGFVGPVVEVAADTPYLTGTLVLRFDEDRLGPVARATMRLFHWKERPGRFEKLPVSGVGARAPYVWARITGPGTYVIIGLHTDPLVLHALRTLCGFGPYLRLAAPEERDRLHRSICEVILCAPDLRGVLEKDPGAVEALLRGALGLGPGEPVPPLPPLVGGPPGGVCDQCLGLDPVGWLPECELLADGLSPVSCVDEGWQDVGPVDLSGCIRQVMVDPTNNDRLYAAAADGGVWRLDSVGAYPTATWVPLTDQQDSLTVTAIAVAASDGQIVYYSDGLGYLWRSNHQGAGWIRTSQARLGDVRRILVHPSDPDTVFVASSIGLQVSGDGGASWTTLRGADVTDAAMDPDDSSIIYIGERGVGVRKSYTSGLTWTTVLPWSAASAPTWTMIKLALGRRGTDTNRTVAVKFHEEVFVNRFGGRPPGVVGPTGWQSKGTLSFMGQWDWDHVIAVDPNDDDVILVGGQVLYRTTTGGDPSPGGGPAWTQVASYYDPHEDQQSLAFDPVSPGVVYLANDGGIWRSTDGGATWHTGNRSADMTTRRNLNRGLVTAQFYRVGVAGDHAVGDVYHSGIIAAADLATRSWQEIEGHAWEFAYVYGDPRRASYFYVFHGALGRRRFPGTGAGDFVLGYGNFQPPGGAAVGGIAADPRLTSSTLLCGASNPGRIMRTLDAAPDAPAWTAVPGVNLGAEPVVSIAFAPSVPGKAYAVSQSGRVLRKDDVNDDTAPAWTAVGQWASPTGNQIRQLAVNSQHDERVYLITAKEVVRSAASGAGPWTSITGSAAAPLPTSDFHSFVAAPDGVTLFLGADIGVFISRDDGANWFPFDADLPNAPIGQIFWSDGYLYAVTYGRGLWRRRPCL
jgi:hypothetical protein